MLAPAPANPQRGLRHMGERLASVHSGLLGQSYIQAASEFQLLSLPQFDLCLEPLRPSRVSG